MSSIAKFKILKCETINMTMSPLSKHHQVVDTPLPHHLHQLKRVLLQEGISRLCLGSWRPENDMNSKITLEVFFSSSTCQYRYLGVGRRAFLGFGVGRRAFRGFSGEFDSRGGRERSCTKGRVSEKSGLLVCWQPGWKAGGRSVMDLDQTSPTFSWWSSQRMRGES